MKVLRRSQFSFLAATTCYALGSLPLGVLMELVEHILPQLCPTVTTTTATLFFALYFVFFIFFLKFIFESIWGKQYPLDTNFCIYWWTIVKNRGFKRFFSFTRETPACFSDAIPLQISSSLEHYTNSFEHFCPQLASYSATFSITVEKAFKLLIDTRLLENYPHDLITYTT